MDMNLFNAAAMVMGLSLAGSAGGLHFCKALTTAELNNIQSAKKTPGALKVFAYAPMSQGLYGIVLFFIIMGIDPAAVDGSLLPAAFAVGVGNMTSAYFQGVVGARVVDMISRGEALKVIPRRGHHPRCQDQGADHRRYGHQAVAAGDDVEHHVDADAGTEDHRADKEPAESDAGLGTEQEAEALGAVVPAREHGRGAEDQRDETQGSCAHKLPISLVKAFAVSVIPDKLARVPARHRSSG
jgi:hypothetical protein